MNGPMTQPPHFTVKPQSTVAEEGSSVTFRCKISAEPPPTVEWFKVLTFAFKRSFELKGSESESVE